MSQTALTSTRTLPDPHRESSYLRSPPLRTLNYYLPPATGPSAPSTNDLELILGDKDQDARRLAVHDLRHGDGGIDLETSLDAAGFTYVTRKGWAGVTGGMTDGEIEGSGYYGQLEGVVRGLYSSDVAPGAIEIYHLGHILRGAPRRTDFSTHKPTSQPTDPAWNRPNRHAAPAPRVHIDFTRAGIEMITTQAFGADSAAHRGVRDRRRRVLAFSLWRPLKQVRRDPLAVCDARSVGAADLVKLPRVYPDGSRAENVVVKAGAGPDGECRHRWYWMSGQTVEELLVIKIYDSAAGRDAWETDPEGAGTIGCAPHCSFHLEGTEGEDVRESIENRVVVVI